MTWSYSDNKKGSWTTAPAAADADAAAPDADAAAAALVPWVALRL